MFALLWVRANFAASMDSTLAARIPLCLFATIDIPMFKGEAALEAWVGGKDRVGVRSLEVKRVRD